MELVADPILAFTVTEQLIRQVRLQQTEAILEPIRFDAAAVRRFGQIVAAVSSAGRTHRSRIVDLFIAAIAYANGLELYTRNPSDFIGLEELIRVVAI
ncbi:PIN domain-containing protein [Acidithrix ferrooxidans]|uniref:PIN domain-containing protein n=1 Tax=Acidithrix ferrooxidans TaxID=1280514 RepID=A0A0D8HCX4_9ACTN|nr:MULTISPECIES: VapC toxin family PIN domain ribonuclease [Acidithrix]KJF15783.1 hypothetical protein AXFE_33670 [Acidithrix ferrooxidans]